MDFKEYQELSARTANDHDYKLANYGLGIAGEAGEVADLVKKAVFHGHDIDADEIKKELGDVMWYLTQLATLAGLELEEIAVANIEKLKKRYPDGFSSVASINREENEEEVFQVGEIVKHKSAAYSENFKIEIIEPSTDGEPVYYLKGPQPKYPILIPADKSNLIKIGV